MKRTNELKQTWNEISGTMRIWGKEIGKGRNAFVKFSSTISKKIDDKEYIDIWFDIKAVKNTELPEDPGEYWIDINKAFFSVEGFVDKSGKQREKLVLVITDGRVIE